MKVAVAGRKQSGITLVGLIFVLAIAGMLGVLGLKVFPTVLEYQAIKKTILTAREGAATPRDIQLSFDKRADVGYITAITGKDLVILKDGNEFQVSFAYDKKIPLFGPASLLLEYEGTTEGAAKRKLVE